MRNTHEKSSPGNSEMLMIVLLQGACQSWLLGPSWHLWQLSHLCGNSLSFKGLGPLGVLCKLQGSGSYFNFWKYERLATETFPFSRTHYLVSFWLVPSRLVLGFGEFRQPFSPFPWLLRREKLLNSIRSWRFQNIWDFKKLEEEFELLYESFLNQETPTQYLVKNLC